MVDGYLNFDTKVDSKGFNAGTKSITSSLGGLKSSLLKVGAAVGIAFGVSKLISFGKQAIETASDLQEVQNVVDTAFGSMSYKMEEFANTSIEQFGISKLAAKQTGSTFMAMANGMGMTQESASDMAISLTGLSADMASFYNVKQDVASTALKSVFTGETETLKQYGIVMTDTNLQEYALSQGITKKTSAMTQAEKVQLRYNYVMSQTKLAQGDFAKTQDSWANQTRILSEKWKEFSGTIGTVLMGVLAPAVKWLNSLLSGLITVANAAAQALSNVFGIQLNNSNATASVADSTAEIADNSESAADSAADTAESTKETADENERQVASFDKINKIDKSSSSGDSNSGSTVASIGTDGGLSLASSENNELDIDTSAVTSKLNALINLFNKFKEALEPIANFTWTALKDFYNNCLKPIGSWVLGDGLPHFADSLSNLTHSIDWGKLIDSLNNLWDSIAPFTINVGEGLLWFFDNVLVPLSTWTMNEVVPVFIYMLSSAIDGLDGIINALKPLGKWLFDDFLVPIADWTGGVIISVLKGISSALKSISDWINNNQTAVQVITISVNAFFSAWKLTQILSFIQQSGGLVACFNKIKTAIWGATGAKITDKIETIKLTAMYAKDFVVSVAKGTAALIKQAAQWVVSTGLKIADTAAQIAMTAATVAWNAVCVIASAVTTAFGAAVAFLTSPIGLVIIAITALIAIVILCVKHWDTIKETAIKCWNAIVNAFKVAGEWFMNTVVTPVGNFFSGLWNGIVSGAKSLWNSIVSIFVGVATWYNNTVVKPITGFFSGLWNGIKDGALNLWNSIKDIFIGMANWYNENVVIPVTGFFSELWDGIKELTSDAWNGIWDGIKTVINLIIDGINMLWKGVYKVVKGIVDAIGGVAGAIGDVFGQDWHFSMPKNPPTIPRLATGTVVPANYGNFLATLGDNKREPEVVSPLSTMKQAFVEALQQIGGVNNGNVIINASGDIGAIVDLLSFKIDKNKYLVGDTI